MKYKQFRLEIAGVFFVIIASVLMQNLYELSEHNLLGIMFGSVNNSIWEISKTLLMPYVLWAIIELLSIKPPFYSFVVSKVIALYFLAVCYILLCLLIHLSGLDFSSLPEFVLAVVSTAFAMWLSLRLTYSDYNLKPLFYPALCMLLFFLALYLSFTIFPPKIYIFMDRQTQLYGLIPEYFDKGAVALDAFYGITK